MKSKKRSENSTVSVGSVNVLTENGVIYQGQIRKFDDRKDYPLIIANQNEFILLELRCLPALLRENAEIREIDPPLYQIGDIIRINIAQIISVGPSGECLGDDDDAAAVQAKG
jgi:hypothetical protein